MRSLLIAVLPATAALSAYAYAQQIPLTAHSESEDYYQFKWPIHKVAIIGGGVGGLIAFRELTQEGLEARIFERDDVPGGNWHYTEETPKRASVPNGDPAVGDYVPSLPPKGARLPYEEVYDDSSPQAHEQFLERRKDHRGPKPLWASLESNAPNPVQQIRELPWPKGTPWALPRETLQRYLRAFASWHGLNSNDNNPHVSFNTRVESVDKRYENGQHAGWTLTLKKFVSTGNHSSKATWWTEDFDAVVVATGRYNAPNIPGIPGLDEWAKQWPDRIIHSREYRRPEPYTNQTVLVVGGAVSGSEISRDVNPVAKKVYQSIRPDGSSSDHFPLARFASRIPANTTIIGEIKRFLPVASDIQSSRIELTNGTIISGIDRLIFGTGFRYTLPFLNQYHDASLGPNDRAPEGTPQPLVTDGSHLRSLFFDVFYIEEPTIAFINMNVGMQSFTYSEFTSLSIAKVWSNTAKLPSTKAQWRHHQEVLQERGGYGKHFLFLGTKRSTENLRYLTSWLNTAAVKYGGRQISPIASTDEITAIWSQARFGFDFTDTTPNNLVGGVDWDSIQDAVYRDDW